MAPTPWGTGGTCPPPHTFKFVSAPLTTSERLCRARAYDQHQPAGISQAGWRHCGCRRRHSTSESNAVSGRWRNHRQSRTRHVRRHYSGHLLNVLTYLQSYAWFPALRFRSSITVSWLVCSTPLAKAKALYYNTCIAHQVTTVTSEALVRHRLGRRCSL